MWSQIALRTKKQTRNLYSYARNYQHCQPHPTGYVENSVTLKASKISQIEPQKPNIPKLSHSPTTSFKAESPVLDFQMVHSTIQQGPKIALVKKIIQKLKKNYTIPELHMFCSRIINSQHAKHQRQQCLLGFRATTPQSSASTSSMLHKQTNNQTDVNPGLSSAFIAFSKNIKCQGGVQEKGR